MLHLARANTPNAVRTLVACMNDEDAPWAARVVAANSLLDRAWGKAKEPLEVRGGGVTSVTIRSVNHGEVYPEAPTIEAEPAPQIFSAPFRDPAKEQP